MSIFFALPRPRALALSAFTLVFAALLIAGCGGISYQRLEKSALNATVVAATESVLSASKDMNMDALAAIRRLPTGAPIDIKQTGCAIKQNHEFFDYDTWEVLSGGVDASGKEYKVEARLNFADGQHNDVVVFLHQFDEGWKVVNLLPDFHYWCP